MVVIISGKCWPVPWLCCIMSTKNEKSKWKTAIQGLAVSVEKARKRCSQRKNRLWKTLWIMWITLCRKHYPKNYVKWCGGVGNRRKTADDCRLLPFGANVSPFALFVWKGIRLALTKRFTGNPAKLQIVFSFAIDEENRPHKEKCIDALRRLCYH